MDYSLAPGRWSAELEEQRLAFRPLNSSGGGGTASSVDFDNVVAAYERADQARRRDMSLAAESRAHSEAADNKIAAVLASRWLGGGGGGYVARGSKRRSLQ